MAGSDYAYYSSRIGDAATPIGWQASCAVDVANWDKTDNFVLAVIITSGSHTPAAETFKLQWTKNGVDWYDVGTGDVIVGASAELVDGNSVGDPSGCAGGTVDDSEEEENDAQVSLQQTTKDNYCEAQFALDISNGDDNTQYTFRLYSTTANAALSDCAAQLTTQSVGTPQYQTITDIVGLLESVTNVADLKVSPTDLAGLTDSVATALAKYLNTGDIIGLLDTVSKIADYHISPTDIIGLADSIKAALATSQTASDIIGLVDTVTAVFVIYITISDSIGLLDSAAATAYLKQLISEVAGLVDSVALQFDAHITITDIAGLLDSVVAALNAKVPVTDIIGLLDTATTVLSYHKSVSDIAGLVDSVDVVYTSGGGAHQYYQTITDIIGLLDTVTLVYTAYNVIADKVGLVDSVDAKWRPKPPKLEVVASFPSMIFFGKRGKMYP